MPEYKFEHFNERIKRENKVANVFAYLILFVIGSFFIGAFVRQFI